MCEPLSILGTLAVVASFIVVMVAMMVAMFYTFAFLTRHNRRDCLVGGCVDCKPLFR